MLWVFDRGLVLANEAVAAVVVPAWENRRILVEVHISTATNALSCSQIALDICCHQCVCFFGGHVRSLLRRMLNIEEREQEYYE